MAFREINKFLTCTSYESVFNSFFCYKFMYTDTLLCIFGYLKSESLYIFGVLFYLMFIELPTSSDPN